MSLRSLPSTIYIAKKSPTDPQKGGRRAIDIYHEPLRAIIIGAMIGTGKDPNVCADCHKTPLTNVQIHHKKYKNATIYDLEFLCGPCNAATRNRNFE